MGDLEERYGRLPTSDRFIWERLMLALRPCRILRWLLAGCLALAVSALHAPAAKAADVLTQRYNTARTGSTTQPGLNPQTVQSPRWGELGRLPVNGIVYAQPLYVENMQAEGQQGRGLVFVATGSNQIYAFDARTLGQAWHVDAGPNDKTAIGKPGCDGISLPGGIGIEATPVIDRANGVMYVSYRVNASGKAEAAQQHLRAIDIRDGHEIADIQILPPQAPADWTKWHRSRAGLLLLNGTVYVGFASRCEDPGTPGFHGWILGYDAKTLKRLAAFSPTLNMPGGQPVDGGGIWQGASGLSADEQGNIYTAVGNRRPNVDGLPPETPSLADSFIKLAPAVARGPSGGAAGIELRLMDWFTPYRRIWLDDQD
ncbi:MAG: hypothetical protein JOY63_05665, partial [Acetobacteraceae bacterium]|nr:hypothetical protein [Acetobacteraceae bacterium]